jgi:hypothetical protein
MNLTSETLEQAVVAGLAMTDPKQDLLQVYREHVVGISILRMLLQGIYDGQIVLSGSQPPAGAQLPTDMQPEDLKPGGTDSDDD